MINQAPSKTRQSKENRNSYLSWLRFFYAHAHYGIYSHAMVNIMSQNGASSRLAHKNMFSLAYEVQLDYLIKTSAT